jgi:hypothetical protein
VLTHDERRFGEACGARAILEEVVAELENGWSGTMMGSAHDGGSLLGAALQDNSLARNLVGR